MGRLSNKKENWERAWPFNIVSTGLSGMKTESWWAQLRRKLTVLLAFSFLVSIDQACSLSQRQRSPETTSRQQNIQVAAAADLKFAMDAIIDVFQQERRDVSVKVSYGSSGNFYSQLSNEAPFDMFFSADISYPRKLVEQGLASPGSEFVYAVGRVVVWVPTASPIELNQLKIEALHHPSVRHLAIANPEHAPYGKAAEAAMRSLGAYESVKNKLVYGENVAQTLQFVQSGAAEIGIVALSLAIAPTVRNQGRYWEIPLGAYPRMEQGGIILKWTRHPEAVQAFRSFILGSKGREVLKLYGFYSSED